MILLYSVLFLAGCWFVISLFLYRIKQGKPYYIQANVYFKMVNLTISNRMIFEATMRNKEVYFEGLNQVFVDRNTYKTLYPESQSNMTLKNKTIKATLKITPLLLSKTPLVNIQDIYILDEPPIIVK